MTALRRIFLRCDLCQEFLESDAIPSSETVVGARKLAHRLGWVHDRIGRDVCPNCRTFPAPKRPGKIHIPIPHWR